MIDKDLFYMEEPTQITDKKEKKFKKYDHSSF